MKMNKTTKNNLITYAMVILAFVIHADIDHVQEVISSLLQGLMVPLCTYIILGSFTEPGCWYPGRAESWSCRFYVRWCIYKCLLFKHVQADVIASDGLRFFLALLIGIGDSSDCSVC